VWDREKDVDRMRERFQVEGMPNAEGHTTESYTSFLISCDFVGAVILVSVCMSLSASSSQYLFCRFGPFFHVKSFL
jgi:hypothetical protein